MLCQRGSSYVQPWCLVAGYSHVRHVGRKQLGFLRDVAELGEACGDGQEMQRGRDVVRC